MSSETFDPYRKWLGIPAGKRPPTHYELLGVALDEDDDDVIRSAAERQRSHVGKFKAGPQRDAAARVLYEIDEAEITLLDPNLRRDYDRQVDLFHKRRKRRQADPFPTARRITSGRRTVGEESGIAREFLAVMAVAVGGFTLMAVVAFALPWPWKNKSAPAKVAPAHLPAAAAVAAPGRPPADIDDPPPAEGNQAATVAEPPGTPALREPAGDPQFVSLFDGNRLAGWQQFRTEQLPNRPRINGVIAVEHHPTDGEWAVRDGQIISVAGEGRRGFIRTEGRYADFILRLEARIPAGCNSGILFRCPHDSNASLSHVAFEVQLLDDFAGKWRKLKPEERSGALWKIEGPARTVLRPDGAWNDIEIRCEANRIRVTLNGETTADVDVTKDPALRSRPQAGFIGLTAEGASAEGPAFRKLEIHELNAERVATRL